LGTVTTYKAGGMVLGAWGMEKGKGRRETWNLETWNILTYSAGDLESPAEV